MNVNMLLSNDVCAGCMRVYAYRLAIRWQIDCQIGRNGLAWAGDG